MTNSKNILKFITCGSVDDGKSTLIGRILFESQLILDDQLEVLKIWNMYLIYFTGDESGLAHLI